MCLAMRFDKLTANGGGECRYEQRRVPPPFVLSLSKDMCLAMRFDGLSTNGGDSRER